MAHAISNGLGGNKTCDVSLRDMVISSELSGHDKTCDVSLREIEYVPPPLQSEPREESPPQWLSLDRSFATALGGMCVLVLGSALMILTSMHQPEAPATLPSSKTAEATPIATAPPQIEPNTQTQIANAQAPQRKQKMRMVTTKRVVHSKIASKQTALRRRAAVVR